MEQTLADRLGAHVPRNLGRHALLALACVVSAAACTQRGHAPAEAAALARTQSPLAWRVNHARVTHHLETSSLETRDALPGHQFVVLDVSVRNRDAQPQVLSEGKLIALDEAKLQTFDQPVTLLSDDYLSLQVLAPAQDLRGKIAYEVPEPLSGVLYWSPGNGSERILLNPLAAPVSTLADAGKDDDSGDNAADTRIQPGDARAVPEPTHAPASAQAAVRKPAADTHPVRIATTQHAPSPKRKADDRQAGVPIDTSVVALADDDTQLTPTPVAMPSPRSTTIAMSTPAPNVRPLATPPVVAGTPAPGEREVARRQACAALVSRDDPADKSANLDFFAGSCRDYPLPEHWRPQPAPRRSLFARMTSRASALLARVVAAPHVVRISDCSETTSRADALVCADPNLSAMEHRLAQVVARASDQVDDPDALQREQARWRGHVRDACNTAQCLQQAYGRRIAQLDAIAPMRP